MLEAIRSIPPCLTAVLCLAQPVFGEAQPNPAAGAPESKAVGHEGGPGLNLILIALTNTRADHLGLYGYDRATSPHLDQLGRKGVVFRNAFAHASWTLPAVLSMLASQYPFTHGLMNREQAGALPPETPTLIDVLKAHGYLTAAFVGNRDYSVKYGHTSRFGSVFEPVADEERGDWQNYGVLEKTLPPARAWLREHRHRKFCLLVQGYDTHCPFAIPKAYPQFDPDYRGDVDFTKCYWTFAPTRPLKVRSPAGEYQDVYLLKTRPTQGDDYEVMFHPEDVRHMIALYDGEIAHADALLGEFLREVAELGLDKKTVIVFYSDHGDMFGKHGRFMRGGPLRGTFYDDVLRMPLILYHPALSHRSVDGIAQAVDLAPTLLELLDCHIPPAFQGKSLKPLLDGGAPVNPHAFAGSAFTPSPRNPFFRHRSTICAARNLEWKLIVESVDYPDGPETELELYDLRQDPDELRNVAGQHPEMRQNLQKALSNWLDQIHAQAYQPKWKD